jgi:hypothetical protein
MKSDWKGSFLLFFAILIGIASYGPLFSERLAASVRQIGANLAPIVLPVLATVLVITVVRNYWSKW